RDGDSARWADRAVTTVLFRSGSLATRSNRLAGSGECGRCSFEPLTAFGPCFVPLPQPHRPCGVLSVCCARIATPWRTRQPPQQGHAEVKQVLARQVETLQRICRLAPEEARDLLLKRVEEDLRGEVGGLVLKYQAAVRESCQQKAREILTTAIQRYAAPHTAEVTVSTVDIPNDEMKGRIIGREGRNIRAFEKATGVDVVVDDTPGVVIVSAFDPVRREIARISLNKLIADGRIHPSRIEELVAETQTEIEQQVRRFGEEAIQETQIRGLNERIINLLGRLHYRTSYSQNVLRHSIEVAFVASMIAEELKMD